MADCCSCSYKQTAPYCTWREVFTSVSTFSCIAPTPPIHVCVCTLYTLPHALFCASLQALTLPNKGVHLGHPELDEPTKIGLQYIFAFSLIWGLGGNLDSTTVAKVRC